MFLKVMKLLGSLCVCQGVAMRDQQHQICQHLMQSRELLLHTSLQPKVYRLAIKYNSCYSFSLSLSLSLVFMLISSLTQHKISQNGTLNFTTLQQAHPKAHHLIIYVLVLLTILHFNPIQVIYI